MRLKLLIFLCVLITKAYTQNPNSPYRVYDFSNLDVSEINTNLIGKQLDSIYRTSGYDSLVQLFTHVRNSTYTEKYVSLNIGYQSTRASLGNLKSGLRSLGFNELSENFSGVPWGGDIRGKKLLVSYVLVPGIKNSASNNDYLIEVNGINLQLAFGYDILRLRRLHFYPQISFGLQDFDIDVTRLNSTADIVNVEDLVFNPAGTELEKSLFDMSYGAELDYHVLYSISRGGIILGLRYARTVTLAEGGFRIHKSKSAFESPDSIDESFFSIVAKFYMKR
jgi:hypothetical protein